MKRWGAVAVLVLALIGAGCASLPEGTYFPARGAPETIRVANILYRAADAAGDDPTRYSFALIRTMHPVAFTDEDATFYISDGLARMPTPLLEAATAHEVAHEVLDHVGSRRPMSAGSVARAAASAAAGAASTWTTGVPASQSARPRRFAVSSTPA